MRFERLTAAAVFGPKTSFIFWNPYGAEKGTGPPILEALWPHRRHGE